MKHPVPVRYLSLSFLATALSLPRGFADSLPRSLVLGATWDMTRDGEMPARDFVRFVLD